METETVGMKEIARLCGVSVRTIHRWIKEEEMPHYQPGRKYRFDRAEVQEWARARTEGKS